MKKQMFGIAFACFAIAVTVSLLGLGNQCTPKQTCAYQAGEPLTLAVRDIPSVPPTFDQQAVDSKLEAMTVAITAMLKDNAETRDKLDSFMSQTHQVAQVDLDSLRQPTKAASTQYQDLEGRVSALEAALAAHNARCTCGQKSVLAARPRGRIVQTCVNGQCTETFIPDAAGAVTCSPAQAAACQAQYGTACQVQGYSSGMFSGGPIQRMRAKRGCRGCN